MRIAVAGGTGLVGGHVVELARAEGHQVVILSRAEGVDLLSADGLTDALAGVDVVIDVVSTQSQKAAESEVFFGTVTRHLLEAETAAGVGHHVALGIVGTDRVRVGYYAGKLLQEQLVEEGPVPWTILRATQFHEFAQQLHGRLRFGPFVVAPVMRSEPVLAREVAARLVRLATNGPAGRATDLGGPQELRMARMVRAYGRRIGDERRVLVVPLPGALGRGLRKGFLVTGPSADHGSITFDEWLASVDPEGR